ncbi:MAG: PEP-CTERM sorting domain-containing protein [Fimbriimonadales bacterium]
MRTIGAFRAFGVLASTTLLALTVSYATVIDFENSWLGSPIPVDYASRVDASGNDSQARGGYNLTFGATPNVAAQMFTADYYGGTWNQLGNLYLWYYNYADLIYVAYHSPSYQGARFIFTADSGYWVRLHSFQMGGWPNTDRTLPFLQVLVDGNPVYSATNVPISGSTANTFSFDPDTTKGSVIEIRFGGDWNVGIDNIGFSQEVVPEPASLLALGAGLASLMGLRRRMR